MCFLSENSIIGYVHQLSPIKTSQNKNQYFDLKLQTGTSVYRTVCFSPEKHKVFKAKYESSSPIKLTKHQLKQNSRTNEDEVHVTKRTKVEDPNEKETDFDYNEVALNEPATQRSAQELKTGEFNIIANITGRVTFYGSAETLNIRGKSLQKQEATFTDDSGSIRIVLWENDIQKLKSGECYDIKRIAVRNFNQQNYLTLNKETLIQPAEKTISRSDENCHTTPTEELQCPPEGLNYIQRFLSCKKCCHKLVIADITKKIVQCSECNLSQLQSKCQKRFLASLLFTKDKENISVQIFDDKIQELYTLYKEQNDPTSTKPVDDLDDDELMEVLLTVKAMITLNSKKTVTTVKKL